MGPSAALNVMAAAKLALRHRGSGKTIVTILCDSGERYASKLYSRRWLEMNDLYHASLEGGDIRFLKEPLIPVGFHSVGLNVKLNLSD